MSMPPESPTPSSAVPQWPHAATDFSPAGLSTAHVPFTFAGWWRRVGALILDGFISTLLLVPGALLVALLLLAGPRRIYESTDRFEETTTFEGPTPAFIVAAVIVGFVWFLATIAFYYGHIQGRKGATWGKKALGIEVVRQDTGEPMGFWPGIGRWFFPALLGNLSVGIFSLLDGLWPLWDKNKQSLHDKMMKTYVVESKPNG